MMNFSLLEYVDLRKILPLIKKEFPYTQMTFLKLRKRFANKQKFLFLRVSQKNELAGFAEVEFIDHMVARINGIAVLQRFRKKGFAKCLLENMLLLLSQMGCIKIILLVKENNTNAKSLYKKFGFKMYDYDKIKKVESLSLNIHPESQYSFAA